MDIIDAKPTWQPTYDDWVQERHNAVARADERDAYAKQVETLTAERDAARKRADVYTKVVDDVMALTSAVHAELKQTRDQRDVLAAQLAQEREVADNWERRYREVTATQAVSGPPCRLSKAKQFGPATFVVRRCKLQDGHDGQCEPA